MIYNHLVLSFEITFLLFYNVLRVTIRIISACNSSLNHMNGYH